MKAARPLISVWLLFLSFIPLAMFVYFGFRWSWTAIKMADDINPRVPLKENLSYFAPGLFLAYRKHERVFPNQTEIRASYKKCGVRAITWFCMTILTLFSLGFLTQ